MNTNTHTKCLLLNIHILFESNLILNLIKEKENTLFASIPCYHIPERS